MGQKSDSDASATTAGPAERFYCALGQAIDEHPNELAVIKNHLQKQVEGRRRLPRPNPDDPKTLVAGAEGTRALRFDPRIESLP